MSDSQFPRYPNDFNKNDLLALLLTLQNKINRDLHVATLCIINSKVSDYSYQCMAFPKANGKGAAIFNALCINDSIKSSIDNALTANETIYAIALMTDMSSDANYEHMLMTNDHLAIDSTSQLHSLNNAVIVATSKESGGSGDSNISATDIYIDW